MARPKAPPRVNGPYPDRDGTRFRVRIFHHDLRRQDLYFHTEKEALAAIAQAKRELQAAQARSLGDVLDEYFAEKERSGRSKLETCQEQRSRVRSFLHRYLDDDIGQITPRRAAALYQEAVERPNPKTGKPMAAASHRFYLALVKGLFAWAVRKGYATNNPFAEVQPVGRIAVGKPQLRIEEAKLFIDEALRRCDQKGSELALGAVVALLMGLRAGEVLNRSARDVDRGGEILWIDSGKTRNARRFLDVPVVLQGRLAQLAGQRASDEPLFGFGRTGKQRRRQVFWRAVGDICRAAGIPQVCPHSLRGLWATLGVQSGAVSQAVAASLGHGSFTMTEKHYAQPEAIRGVRTARMIEMLSLGSEGSTTQPHQAAEQLLKSLPREVLDSLVALHRCNGK
mgnify:CR=1 FL=1